MHALCPSQPLIFLAFLCLVYQLFVFSYSPQKQGVPLSYSLETARLPWLLSSSEAYASSPTGTAVSQGASLSSACFSPIQFVALADGDPSGTPARGLLTIHSSGWLAGQ